MTDLTGANAVIMLSIAGLFNFPQQLQGFAADDVFDTEALESAETRMGVDGILSAGFVFVPVRQGYALQADSPSIFIFDTWWATQQTTESIFRATGTIIMPALGKQWSLTRGVLHSYIPIPTVKKLAQPQKFGIVWERVIPTIVI
jgi:hypothetical protein